MGLFSNIFGDTNKRFVKSVGPAVEKINELEKDYEKLSGPELKEKTREFRGRFKNGESLENLLPEAFAAVREAAKRTLNQRHFDVQLIGGIALHKGKIAEMKTGEGKTLTATSAVYLNALSGQGAHVITVNDYLARRDTVWMGQIYDALGMSVGCINHEASYLYDPGHTEKNPNDKIQISNKIQNPNDQNNFDKTRDALGAFKVVHEFLRPVARREVYEADITYGTNNEFGFDYLRDNMVYDASQMVQRPGADIDGIKTRPESPAQREGNIGAGTHNFAIVDEVDSILIDEARTPLIISVPDAESGELYRAFAKFVPRLSENEDYTIDEKLKTASITDSGINKVEKMLGIKNIYEEGGMRQVHHLEQALRAHALFRRDKDYVVKNGEVIIVDEFTGRLMPGRRWSEGLHQAVEAKEGVAVQKESRTLATITFQNYFKLYKKLAGMTGTAATSSEEFHKVYGLDVVAIPTHKPMIRRDLADRIYKTESAKWKAVTEEIKERHLKLQPVLVGTVSIQKNELLSAMLKREGISHNVLNAKNHESEAQIIAQAGKPGQVTVATNMAGRGVDIILGGNPPDPSLQYQVIQSGGLHVIGTDRHEARRIDNQLRGRAGRQGDAGSSQFFISLDDDVVRIFGGERIKNMMESLGFPEDQPIEHGLVSRAIEQAQSKIEGHHFDARKYVLEFDNVMNKHRETIYGLRREVLASENLKEKILKYFHELGQGGDALSLYGQKEKEIGEENMRRFERFLLLRVIDELWVDHLEAMDYLRNSVNLRAYGQRDPLVEYRIEGQRMFEQLLQSIKHQVVNLILRAGISIQPQQPQPVSVSKPSNQKNIGRNDPCWCGAKNPDGRPKKFKKCHGQP